MKVPFLSGSSPSHLTFSCLVVLFVISWGTNVCTLKVWSNHRVLLALHVSEACFLFVFFLIFFFWGLFITSSVSIFSFLSVAKLILCSLNQITMLLYVLFSEYIIQLCHYLFLFPPAIFLPTWLCLNLSNTTPRAFSTEAPHGLYHHTCNGSG